MVKRKSTALIDSDSSNDSESDLDSVRKIQIMQHNLSTKHFEF